MGFIIGLLTFVMVLDCLVLIFLVLLQLPKKDAGAGLAFGGGTTDALFGAGSGTVLTKITRYSATIFFVLAFLLGILQSRFSGRRSSDFEKALQKAGTVAPVTPGPAAPAVPVAPATTGTGTTNALMSQPSTSTTAPATAPATGTNR